jgi:ABC-type multidrug transport system fused ATPase/permease subunit
VSGAAGGAADRLPIADRRQVRAAAVALIRRDGRAALLVLGLNATAAAVGVAAPWLLGRIVDQVQAGAGASTVDGLALAICACVAVQLLLNRTARYAGHTFGERAVAGLREDFVQRTLALPISTVERAGAGDLMTRSTVDVPMVGRAVRDGLPTIFISVLQIAFVVLALVLLDVRLGLCALLGVPTVGLATRWYLRRARTAYLAEGAALTEMSDVLAAAVGGARTIETLRLASARLAAADERAARALATRLRTLWLRTVFFPVLEASHALPVAGALLLGGALYFDGRISLGTVVTATLLLRQMIEPVDFVMQWLEQLQRGAASFARVLGVGQAVPQARQSYPQPAGDVLELRGVRFAYQDGRDVLHGIDLAVRPGERLAVVGASGAGKSTLARLLAGIDPPTSGQVTVGGVPVTDLDPVERSRRIALVTQEHHVFLGTLRDNLALAAPQAGDERLWAALDAVGARWARALPAGLSTEFGMQGLQPGSVTLDAAAAQQLSLARVVLADPHTLVLDEATAMLDPTTARDTERALGAVLAGRTVIAIAHRLNTAHDADRVAVMDGGRITELGSHDELVGAGGSYAALWRSWHGD